MFKLKIILMMVVPMMEVAAAFLEAQDANTTGVDDNAAKALRIACAAIKELSKPDPV